ncbi:hypothetical protein AM587_10015148 [Phytophthora nicotianae]|uniref:Uncharacterized protein n=1 Tax=Phytophthora nicotianae TaxID=4792 RepID=A0A0W8BG16_PHYNI|nr:hypothetical protein AM587_10015148 [Phytophthora nicotianae]
MDVVIKDTLDGNNGDNNDDIQVTDSSTMDKSRVSELGSVKTSVPEEPSEEPKLDENVHAALKQIATAPLSSEDQSNTESAPDPTSKNEESHTELPISSTSADLVEADEVTKAKNEQLPVGKSLQAPVDANNDDVEVKKFVPTDQSEAVEVESNGQPCIQEAQLRDEDSSVANTGDEDVDEVDLTPDQSTESFPTKPSGFLESLTADFAPDTKVMWAQIFGPRYEDDDEAAYFQEDNQSNAGSSRESVSSKSSLQAKLARERKLDEQIQASQRRYRERVEHVVNMKLPSVVCAQRLVFYRYLIDIVAAERIRVHSKTAELQEPPVQSPARRKSTTGRRKSSTKRKLVQHAPESEATTRSCEQPVDNEETATIRSEHESLPSASEADGVSDTPAEEDIFELPEQVGDECEKPASQLQQQLESAIAQLRQTLPNIDSDADLNPAIRATYLAAAACHESVLLMLDNNIDVDAAMSNKLRHFIEALESIQATEQIVTTAPVEVEGLDHQLRDPLRFPPPYPESTVSEEEDSKSETSTLQQQFPPPYAITSPSYWTFTPSIPEPKSSISKLASKSATNKSVDLRSQFLSKESPGVGAYNVEKGENLTFQRKPSYSFGPTEGDRDRKAPNALLSNGSTGKRSSRSTLRQRMKTSFEFVPRTDHSAENNGIDFNTSTRVHVDSKFEDSHIGTNGDLFNDLPPDYNEGDANEASEEKAGGSDETEMDRALRLQQRIFMDEFVHQVMSNQDSHTHFVPRGKQNTTNANISKSQPYWATSEVSPGIERLLNRQRRAPTANKFRPSSASTAPIRTTNRVAKKAPPPLRRQLDNDQHLAWAARISELYQPAVPAPDQ